MFPSPPPFWQLRAENIFEKNMTAERHKFTQTGNALDTHIFSYIWISKFNV